jgi:predicted transglutaminase-like cysteine proteinase
MRRTRYLCVACAMAAALWVSNLQAGLLGLPQVLRSETDHIRSDGPVLAPMAHVRFCLRYYDDCEIRGTDFRRRNLTLTPQRWRELNTVNRQVNRNITAEANVGGVMHEEWLISPPAGDCNDYAVTKRHELLAHGWPSRVLLLSEVVVPSGQHHLVLLVRMKNVDLVLDNLNANVRSVGTTYSQYHWVRIESPQNPRLWESVRSPASVHLTMTRGVD